MPGDEMTLVIWPMIRENLIAPFVELITEVYDLGLRHRFDTDDRVTHEAAKAIRRHGVGVKCATITGNAARQKEFSWLTKNTPSPNGTIRNILAPEGGAIIRAPILVPGVINPFVSRWTKPIVVARHPFGCLYANKEIAVPGPGKVKLVYEADNGANQEVVLHEFTGPGVAQAQFNLDASIRGYAEECVTEACARRIDLWFGVKDTISRIYHGRFKDIFAQVVKERQAELDAAGINYYYMLIDDAVARVIQSEGGFLLALMNYDGDVQSDFVAAGFGSLGMMTSVLTTPNGIEYEAAHGTVQRHFYAHQKGQRTSTNSVASIYAWTGALKKRGELDGNQDLTRFGLDLEQSVIETIQAGQMTGDLAVLAGKRKEDGLDTVEFIDAVRETLARRYR
jgi:isocitrate dehydrogenase